MQPEITGHIVSFRDTFDAYLERILKEDTEGLSNQCFQLSEFTNEFDFVVDLLVRGKMNTLRSNDERELFELFEYSQISIVLDNGVEVSVPLACKLQRLDFIGIVSYLSHGYQLNSRPCQDCPLLDSEYCTVNNSKIDISGIPLSSTIATDFVRKITLEDLNHLNPYPKGFIFLTLYMLFGKNVFDISEDQKSLFEYITQQNIGLINHLATSDRFPLELEHINAPGKLNAFLKYIFPSINLELAENTLKTLGGFTIKEGMFLTTLQ